MHEIIHFPQFKRFNAGSFHKRTSDEFTKGGSAKGAVILIGVTQLKVVYTLEREDIV